MEMAQVVLDFTLKDEMIIADEAHMKKLQMGTLNFQRVAFEQRVRKGRNMNRLSPFSNDKDTAVEESETTSLDDDDGEIENILPPPKILQHRIPEGENVSKEPSKNIPVESAVVDDGQQPCCSKSLDELPSSVGSSCSPPPVSEEMASAVSDTTPTNVLKLTACGSKRKVHKAEVAIKTPREVKKRRVTFNTPPAPNTLLAADVTASSKPLRGVIEEYIGTSNGFLNGFFSRVSNHEHTTKYISSSSSADHSFKRNRTLVYTQLERKHSKLSRYVNIFKETNLFASRTSLAMHRSLNIERLDPTNAMNTHDALVINPVNVKMNIIVSPYRSFFSKVKHKLTDEENEVWKRIRSGVKINHVNLNRLSSEDYAGILKNSLQFDENLVAEHLQVVSMVKAAGNVGIDLISLKVINCLLIKKCIIIGN